MIDKQSAEEKNRRARLEEIKKRGIDPYPHRFDRSHLILEVCEQFSEWEGHTETEDRVRLAGRMMSLRGFGKGAFADLEDWSGKIQLFVSQNRLGDEAYEIFKLFDRGDIIGIEGPLFRTRTKELTVACEKVTLLAKCIRPLPEKWHGLRDIETMRRQRYLHLIVDAETRNRFIKRSQIIAEVRQFIESRGFLEVSTPILQPIYGGAEARPFTTYHNVLDRELYLRISPELYLKRLIAGGFDKVYEIATCFRNEGMDAEHNPEFTLMELYWSYADYQNMMTFTEELFSEVAMKCNGGLKVIYKSLDGAIEREIDLTPPFKRWTLFEAIERYTGEDVSQLKTREDAENLARKLSVSVEKWLTLDGIIMEIFKEKVEVQLIQPTFIYDYPSDYCPLTKKHRLNPVLAERFELYINGMEYANAYSELTDPNHQAHQFELQRQRRALGDFVLW
jgi:lysyl-tRNA synthetase class 2